MVENWRKDPLGELFGIIAILLFICVILSACTHTIKPDEESKVFIHRLEQRIDKLTDRLERLENLHLSIDKSTDAIIKLRIVMESLEDRLESYGIRKRNNDDDD